MTGLLLGHNQPQQFTKKVFIKRLQAQFCGSWNAFLQASTGEVTSTCTTGDDGDSQQTSQRDQYYVLRYSIAAGCG